MDRHTEQMHAAILADLNGQDRSQVGNTGGGAGPRGQESGRDAAADRAPASGTGRFRRLLEATLRRGPRAFEPFTERSAALARVGITQSAYEEMRRPGADREKVKQNYESALRVLGERIQADGLDPAAVDRNMRVVVGHLIDRDPGQAAVFSELGHGQYVKTDARGVFRPGSTEPMEVWDGNYVNAHSGEMLTEGPLNLREPMQADEHRTEVAKTIYGELASASTPAEFGAAMEQYVIGSATRRYPESVEMVEDPEARARLNRSRAMFSSMQDDGLSDQDQKLVYAGGLSEAMRTLEETHPEKVAEWRKSLGPEWEQRMQDLIEEYRDFGEKVVTEREQQREAQGRTGPEQETSPEPGSGNEVDPEATAEPEATDGPEATDDPKTAADPEVTGGPETSDDPEATNDPEAAPDVPAPDDRERDGSPRPSESGPEAAPEEPDPADREKPVGEADPQDKGQDSEAPRPKDASQARISDHLSRLASGGPQAWPTGQRQGGPQTSSPEAEDMSR